MNLIDQVKAGKPRLKDKPALQVVPTRILTEILAAKMDFCKGRVMKLVDIFRICLIATVVLAVAIPMIQGA
jgi:hypothetical protein